MATAKQKAAFKEVLENRGNVSKAMKAVGYPPATAKNPQQLTTSKGWLELCEAAGLNDQELIRVAKEGLNASKVISANITYGDADEKTNDFIEVPDHPTRHKFLETGLKMIGRAHDVPEQPKTIIIITSQSTQRYGAIASTSDNSA